jgi:hypothetical protein
MTLPRTFFLRVLKIWATDSCYFMHAMENHALYGNVRQRHYVMSFLLLKGELRYPFAGGQSFNCPLARTATVLGRN